MTIKISCRTDICYICSVEKIQSLWRGHLVRKNFLYKKLYELGVAFILQNPTMEDVPRASAGVTPVYLPLSLPLVFKNLGEDRAIRRFCYIWKAKELCFKNGYQFLLIPNARPHMNFNIEEKLPVHDVTTREQICLYVENKDKFSASAKEFAGLLCQSIFPDILAHEHPYKDQNNIPLRRCDNVPLMIRNERGYIALIDLGGFQVRNGELLYKDAFEAAKTAVCFFPYHVVEIMEVVHSFCPEMIPMLPFFEKLAEQTIVMFKNIYWNHQIFIQNKPQVCASDILGKISTKLTAVFDYKNRMITIKVVHQRDSLEEVMQKLIERNIICYANFYYNRSSELNLRIHY